ncbi:MAG TPA: helix-turn-helix transcriptional regulator [Solirubrobacteraceae bacterium]|jgi:transcriptional regulator with XRE-family HTH domain|nr:helix-turn-helix transcriptional regulator [Solirubrobacteraceae bacterium]
MPAKKSLANQTLGKAIRSARESHGYAQEAFARQASMDRSYYGAIERGEFNVSVDTVIKIATALEMTACELFGRAKL